MKIEFPHALFNIHIHSSDTEALEEIKQLIITNTNKIMATLDDLNAKVAELQTSVDAEQAQIAALLETNAGVIQGLNDQIAVLQTALSEAPTPEQIQGVIDGLEAIKADVEATV